MAFAPTNMAAAREKKVVCKKTSFDEEVLKADSIPSHVNRAFLLRAGLTKKNNEEKLKSSKIDSFNKVLKKLREKEIKNKILERSVINDVTALREKLSEKVQSRRQEEAERERQYKEEVRMLEGRVLQRPLLFEQLIVRQAREKAEQIHRGILEEHNVELSDIYRSKILTENFTIDKYKNDNNNNNYNSIGKNENKDKKENNKTKSSTSNDTSRPEKEKDSSEDFADNFFELNYGKRG